MDNDDVRLIWSEREEEKKRTLYSIHLLESSSLLPKRRPLLSLWSLSFPSSSFFDLVSPLLARMFLPFSRLSRENSHYKGVEVYGKPLNFS